MLGVVRKGAVKPFWLRPHGASQTSPKGHADRDRECLYDPRDETQESARDLDLGDKPDEDADHDGAQQGPPASHDRSEDQTGCNKGWGHHGVAIGSPGRKLKACPARIRSRPDG